MHHRNTALLHLPCDPPVEGRRINDDGKIGLSSISFPDQVVEQAIDFGKVAEDFGDAHYGEIFGVDHRVATRVAHARPADSKEFETWVAPPESLHELRAVHFTGSLAGGDQDLHERIVKPVGTTPVA